MTRPWFDFTSSEFKSNPTTTLIRLRKAGPLVRTWIDQIGEVWMTTNYETTAAVLRNRNLFVTDPSDIEKKKHTKNKWSLPDSMETLHGLLRSKDQRCQDRINNLIESKFVRQSIEQLRPRIAILADGCLDLLERNTKLAECPVNFIEEFARPFSLSVISDVLGQTEEERTFLKAWADRFSPISGTFGLLKAIPSLWKINGYHWRQFVACPTFSRPGIISTMITAEEWSDQYSFGEFMTSMFLLILTFHESVIQLLNLSILTLLHHGEQKNNLLADWSQVGIAIDEIIRFTSPLQMAKPHYATQDVELSGTYLKKGEIIVPLLAAANSDPDKFVRPEFFDISRTPNPYLCFDSGRHINWELKLIKAEVEIAIEKIFTRYPKIRLASPERGIEWIERVGDRSIKELPLFVSSVARSMNKGNCCVA